MEDITIALLERIGLLLIAAFIVSRIHSFKNLIYREYNWKTVVLYSVLFGLFAIAGTTSGVTISDGELIRSLFVSFLAEGDGLAHSGIMGIIMGGLLGGPVVGLGAGMIAGLHFNIIGGLSGTAYAASAPFIGLLAGATARFFSEEKVISPAKSFFIGMFAIILCMCSILIFTRPHDEAVHLVNMIGIPMVVANSGAIAIFTAMIRIVLNEKEHAQAMETRRALNLAQKVLPYLKQGLNPHTAKQTAQLMMNELEPAAVAVTDDRQILAHIGMGEDHHKSGAVLQTQSSLQALENGHVQVITNGEDIQCKHAHCPLRAAILVPFSQSGSVKGLIKLYFSRPQQIRAVDIVVAQGLGKLISHQLSLAEAEQMRSLMKDAELRRLQAQVNPHFLFNTLNSIVSLIRTDSRSARRVTLGLAQFMRTNLNILSQSLVTLEQELEHLRAYVDIVQARFSDQLQIRLDIEHPESEVLIPPSTLQPLVENSIHHGLKHRSTGGLIEVIIRPQCENIHIIIQDNGKGIPDELLADLGEKPLANTSSSGIGVYNVNQRLISLLGKNAGLHISNQPGGGCRIQFSVPEK